MFKKNKNREDESLDIGMQEIEVPDVEDKPRKQNWFSKQPLFIKLILYGVIFILLLILLSAIFSEKEEIAPSEVDEVIVYNDPVTDDEDYELTEPETGLLEEDIVSDKDTGTTEYSNSIISLAFNYPSNWFMIERTNESLSRLTMVMDRNIDDEGNKVELQKLDLKTYKIHNQFEVVDFETRIEDEARLYVYIMPRSTLDKEFIEPRAKGSLEEVSNDNGFKTQGYSEYGEEYRVVTKIVPYGINFFMVRLYIKDGYDIQGYLEIMEQILKEVDTGELLEEDKTKDGEVKTVEDDPVEGEPNEDENKSEEVIEENNQTQG